mmetsp:Transcript_13094/g.30497  ORF Transcript_13094/g.30497 Transcript_13094/m.30497 type:complete len:279 (-) Transcript_13094:1492-2328(-)
MNIQPKFTSERPHWMQDTTPPQQETLKKVLKMLERLVGLPDQDPGFKEKLDGALKAVREGIEFEHAQQNQYVESFLNCEDESTSDSGASRATTAMSADTHVLQGAEELKELMAKLEKAKSPEQQRELIQRMINELSTMKLAPEHADSEGGMGVDGPSTKRQKCLDWNAAHQGCQLAKKIAEFFGHGRKSVFPEDLCRTHAVESRPGEHKMLAFFGEGEAKDAEAYLQLLKTHFQQKDQEYSNSWSPATITLFNFFLVEGRLSELINSVSYKDFCGRMA